MNINTPAGSKLQAALLAAMSLGDTAGSPSDSAAAAALTGVLGAFAEMIASAVFPAIPVVEGVKMVADQTQEQMLVELRELNKQVAALLTSERDRSATLSNASPPSEANLPAWMADIAARALCQRVVPDSDGKTLAEAGAELTTALLALNSRTCRG